MTKMTDGKWLIDLKNLESEYNNRRWNFRNKFKRYIRNNPYSDKYTEEELIQDLEKLKTVREKMKKLSKENNFKDEHRKLYTKDATDFCMRAANPVWEEYEE